MPQDPVAGVAALDDLAKRGSARAASKLAFYTLRGIGRPKDTDEAIRLYRHAVDLGSDRTLLSLAKVLASEKRYDEAADALTTAQARDVKGARVAWLEASALSRLGTHSDPDSAWQDLQILAQQADPIAERAALYVAWKRRAAIPNDAPVIARHRALAMDGDAKAAERLVRYLRTRTSGQGSYLTLRAELLALPGIRPAVRAEEALHVARLREASTFWQAAERIVSSVDEDSYARALFVTSRINKNAYVAILQRDLETLGYTPGEATGYLNIETLRAVYRFCDDRTIQKACVPGPAKSSTIRIVSRELAEALVEGGHFDRLHTDG
ncbi:MAG: hypothetical protein AAF218_04750 [Pseudomonadota bacterium]